MRTSGMRTSVVRCYLTWMAMLLLACGLFAQSTTDGAIGGTVADQSGAVVPNAAVSAKNLSTGASASGSSDDGGRFLIIHLQPGVYSLEIKASGFSAFRATSITVEVGRTTTVDATLGVQAQTETIVATAEAPVITTDRADFSTNINSTSIDNLPINGRRWSSFALGTPGAVPDGGFGLVSFRGISGLLNNNTVDGADNNQAFFSEERGRTRISYSTSEAAIQEFQINTSNYSAEYGRSAGGVVNAVTKSGTNSIHGQAFWFDRTSDFGAINPFSFKKVLVNGALTSVPFLPPDKRHQFGGGIGGAIIKDKLFWFLSGDQQLRSFPGTGNSGTPGAIFAPIAVADPATGPTGLTCAQAKPSTPKITEGNILFCRGFTQAQVNTAISFLSSLTGQVSRTGDQLILLPKIDWNINSKNHLSVTYNRLRWASPQGVQTAGVVNRGIESFGSDFVKEDWGIARWTSILTPTLTNELRYQIGRDFEFEFAQPPIAGQPVSSKKSSPQITVNGVGGFVFGKPNFLDRPAFPKEMRNQVADTFSWSHGTHLVKFGFDFSHVNDVENNLFNGAGAYSYNNRADYISDYVTSTNTLASVCAASNISMKGTLPCYSNFSQSLGPTTYIFNTNDLAFFGQDDWRIRPRLTLNLGLRFEAERMPSPQFPNSAIPGTNVFPSDLSDFGPRIGAAWDVTGKGKTILRGGYGIYYGRIINSTIANAISNTANPTGSQLSFFFNQGNAGEPLYPNIVVGGTPGTLQAVQFASNTRNPMVHEFDLDFQREIATNTVVSVSYLGSLGRRLPRFVDSNLLAPTASVTYTINGGPFGGQTLTVPVFTAPTSGLPTAPNRPNPSFGAITNISGSVTSNYNAAVIALNRRFYKGFQIQTSFTYSRVNDAGQSSQTFTATNNVLNPFNLGLEQSRSNFDIRERFAFGAVWTPDVYKGESKVLKQVVNGFTISPLISAASGAPFTPTLSGTAPPVTATGVQCTLPKPPAVNTTCFPLVSSGVLGAGGTNRMPNLSPNSFQMPHIVNVDLRLQKGFNIWEKVKFTLTGDAFNLFNHFNVTAVSTQMYAISGSSLNFQDGISNTTKFGIPTQSSNSIIAQRQIQIGARLDF
jgi:Carboxypeptidase regulatory-like domain/TonB dependent receptor